MTSDHDGLLKNISNGTISGAGPSEIVVSESLDDTTPSESNEFGDCGTLKRLFKKSADIRNKFKGVSSSTVHQSGPIYIFIVFSLFANIFFFSLEYLCFRESHVGYRY